MDKATKKNQIQQAFEAFRERPKTMLEVAKETDILRENICRYCDYLTKQNKMIEVRTGKCPVSGHKAAFYSTDPDLIPKPGQAEIFPQKRQGAYSR